MFLCVGTGRLNQFRKKKNQEKSLENLDNFTRPILGQTLTIYFVKHKIFTKISISIGLLNRLNPSPYYMELITTGKTAA